jgi:hypothetical protein
MYIYMSFMSSSHAILAGFMCLDKRFRERVDFLTYCLIVTVTSV